CASQHLSSLPSSASSRSPRQFSLRTPNSLNAGWVFVQRQRWRIISAGMVVEGATATEIIIVMAMSTTTGGTEGIAVDIAARKSRMALMLSRITDAEADTTVTSTTATVTDTTAGTEATGVGTKTQTRRLPMPKILVLRTRGVVGGTETATAMVANVDIVTDTTVEATAANTADMEDTVDMAGMVVAVAATGGAEVWRPRPKTTSMAGTTDTATTMGTATTTGMATATATTTATATATTTTATATATLAATVGEGCRIILAKSVPV
ncbi:hypothetical protein FB45DRAFT_1095892, partial [Roridomyces roridus]